MIISKIAIGAIAGLVALVAAGSAKAAEGGGTKDGKTPLGGGLDLEVAEALATQNPAKMRVKAAELDRRGYHEAAQGLRDEADRIEAGGGPTPGPLHGKSIKTKIGECWRVKLSASQPWTATDSATMRAMMSSIAEVVSVSGEGTRTPEAVLCYRKAGVITLDTPIRMGNRSLTATHAEKIARPGTADAAKAARAREAAAKAAAAAEAAAKAKRAAAAAAGTAEAAKAKRAADAAAAAAIKAAADAAAAAAAAAAAETGGGGGGGGGGGVDEDPQRVRAQMLSEHLRSIGGLAGRNSEDKELVRAYQVGEGLTADGLYGPGVAITILEHYGLVPSVPLHWSKVSSRNAAQKAEFSRRVRAFAASDPGRADEYARLLKDTERS